MKSLDTVLEERKKQLAKYLADKEEKGKEITAFKQTVEDSLITDLTMDKELADKAKAYNEEEAALELGRTGFYKNAKLTKPQIKAEKQKLYDVVCSLKAVPMKAEDIKVITPLFEGMTMRMEKAWANYDIQIKDAKRDILLYQLMLNVKDKKDLQPEGYEQYLNSLLEEKKSGGPKLPKLELKEGMSMAEMQKLSVDKLGHEDWKELGLAMDFYHLTLGQGMKLVKKTA